MKRLGRMSVAGAAVIGLCGIGTGLAPAAGASASSHPWAEMISNGNYQGTSAGYISPASPKITRFQGATDVPALNCSASSGNPSTAAMYQSLQLYDDAAEAGSGLFVFDECNSGAPTYALETFVATGPSSDTFDPTGITVSPGDIVEGLMTVSSTGSIKVSVKDVTTKSSVFTESGTVAAGGSYSGFAYIQNDLPAEPIPTFGRGLIGPGSGDIGWYALKVDGEPMSDTHAKAYNMVNPANNDLMIETSAMGSTGTTFSNAFVANQ
jgi:hypothetical protein